MLQSVKNNGVVKFLFASYIIVFVWWLLLLLSGSVNTPINYYFAFSFSIIPLVGGIAGIINVKRWWGFASSVGKFILFISLGLLTWGMGQFIFSWYNLFLNVEVPYPSLADASFILSWPLWGVGIVYLSKATGARFGLRSLYGKLALFAIPLITIPLSYYILVTVARGGVLFSSKGFAKLFFDLAYPISDLVLLTMVVLVYSLSFNYLGGKFRTTVYLIFAGILINYIGDFFFSYTTTIETFYSGNWVDFLFATAMFILSLGVATLNPTFLKGDKV